ncbi:hypothetical protein [Planococcus sp. S3-L1]|uniref:hypothetical protein n=1 Tax=Planococcus sp. S3-L1 TaxID=3046200 RepID=UPI0024B8C0CF|nr:hypothetical protein [Planococcus sp. S3-L1]MDJ0333534.1 hypothetical protein [Planococcus sp. S3-L1]
MKKSISLIILLFILSGCGNGSDRYNFSGSSDNWDVFYVVDVSNPTEQQQTGTINFRGEESGPETMDYSIKYSGGSSSGIDVPLVNGTANTGRGACQGCAVIQKDEEIEVEITWNGQTEKLILINKK